MNEQSMHDRPSAGQPNKEVRQEVLAQVISVYAAADDEGSDGWKACQRAFPGIPEAVLIEAMCEVDDRKTERWWDTVEKTIDGEVIRNAIIKAGERQ